MLGHILGSWSEARHIAQVLPTFLIELYTPQCIFLHNLLSINWGFFYLLLKAVGEENWENVFKIGVAPFSRKKCTSTEMKRQKFHFYYLPCSKCACNDTSETQFNDLINKGLYFSSARAESASLMMSIMRKTYLIIISYTYSSKSIKKIQNSIVHYVLINNFFLLNIFLFYSLQISFFLGVF